MELPSAMDELAQLRATVARLTERLDSTSAQPRRNSGAWRRRAALFGGIACAGLLVVGVAGASTPGNPADVSFIALSVPHKILSNVSIAKGATNSTAVNGGSTTVPTDASSVQMTVAVKSSAAGTLSVFPTDHAASTSADTISFAAGNVVTTQTSNQSPGLSSKVSFKNNGTATAVVTVTITGYSTQTTASNISGSGGTAGQVLTDNGVGGASWQAAGGAAFSNVDVPPIVLNNVGYTTVLSLPVSPGSYFVTYSGDVRASVNDTVDCDIHSPTGNNGAPAAVSLAANTDVQIVAQGLVNAPAGGTVSAQCVDSTNSAVVAPIGFPVLTAVQVQSVGGSYIISSRTRAAIK